MIKQVKAVKVYWNDEQGTRPSFYPDMESALASVGRVLSSGGSAANIALKETTRLVNTDNDRDMSWYASHVGKTRSDLVEKASSKKSRRRAKDAVPSGFVQPELPIQVNPICPVAKPVTTFQAQNKPRKRRAVKMTLGDPGFEDRFNPARREAGSAGGTSSHAPRAASPDRRKRGEAGIKDMTAAEHREYWRWADARKRARKAGITPPSWDTWQLCASR